MFDKHLLSEQFEDDGVCHVNTFLSFVILQETRTTKKKKKNGVRKNLNAEKKVGPIIDNDDDNDHTGQF